MDTRYYPFGLTHNQNPQRQLENKYLFNGNSEFQTDLGLGWHQSFKRMYDPQIGRFWGIDALSDLLPGENPFAYAHNNPIFFNDPLGLMSVPGCDECGDATVLDEVVVQATRLPSYSALFYQFASSSNPIYRDLGLRYQRGDNNYLQHAFNQTPIRYGEGLGYETEFMQGLNKIGEGLSTGLIYGSFGVVASPLLAYGAPIWGEFSLAQAGIEAGTQITTNLFMHGNVEALDIADVLIAGTGLGVLGSSTLGAMIDIQPLAARGNQVSIVGFGKEIPDVAVDFGVGLVSGGTSNFIKGKGYQLYSGLSSGFSSSANVGWRYKGMSSTYSNIWQITVDLYSKGFGGIIKSGTSAGNQ